MSIDSTGARRRVRLALSAELDGMQAFVLLSSTTITVAIVLFLLSPRWSGFGPVVGQLTGSSRPCENEGEPVVLTDIRDAVCFNCLCKNKIVQCDELKCPTDAKDCDKLREIQKYACCQNCIDGLSHSADDKPKAPKEPDNATSSNSIAEQNACTMNGTHHGSGTEWTDPSDPCTNYACISGVITESSIRCVVPCDEPRPPVPGQCCYSCRECRNNQRKVSDPCVTCSCSLGWLTCTRKTCPVLNCNKSLIAYDSDKCCPRCIEGEKAPPAPRDGCAIGTSLYKEGIRYKLDDCTHCSCSNSTAHCTRFSCPALRCAAKQRDIVPGRCCPRCREIEDVVAEEKLEVGDDGKGQEDGRGGGTKQPKSRRGRLDCSQSGETYKVGIARADVESNESLLADATSLPKDGESWSSSNCENCTCKNGRINCTTTMCPFVRCPANSELTIPDGQCCPVCEERVAVCTVYGGTHFRSFDGKLYSFLGSCNYQLASDCGEGSFDVQLKNEVIGNDAITKRVSLKLGKARLDLLRGRGARVNERLVELPHRTARLELLGTKDEVTVAWKPGLKLRWSYLGMVEVSVASRYRGQLCGLCGDFNGSPEDDLTTREEIRVDEPAVFAQSWATGEDEVCLDTRKHGARGCDPKRDKRLCSYVKGSVFERCLRRINVSFYYERCLKDMCDCHVDDRSCHCESFASYVRDCERLGILLPDWRSAVGCFIR